ncbi:vesicle-associated membrane protein 5-like [Scleropages formosus]|uniref:Vesicle-associated membrane protein 5-like n=1 Tax=Scleropages formosus TaxID=113540 RepID=A0A8C9V1Z3_SCLFO|nr:vesicle-associated membrane protein 5-like [Scleropages formosus]
MTSGNSRLEKVHQEVDEVKTIMLDNINKNEERSGKLKELEDRADQVCVKSKSFRRTTVRVKQQSQWKNRKMKILLIAIVAGVVLVFIIIVIVFLSGSKSSSSEVAISDPAIALTTTPPRGN